MTGRSLGRPVSFTAKAVSATQINLAWTPVAGATGYLVDESINGAWKQIGSLGSGSTGYAVTGLSPDTTYSFDVAAYNAAGPTWANYQSATTSPGGPVFHGQGGFSDADQPGVDPGSRRDRLPGR